MQFHWQHSIKYTVKPSKSNLISSLAVPLGSDYRLTSRHPAYEKKTEKSEKKQQNRKYKNQVRGWDRVFEDHHLPSDGLYLRFGPFSFALLSSDSVFESTEFACFFSLSLVDSLPHFFRRNFPIFFAFFSLTGRSPLRSRPFVVRVRLFFLSSFSSFFFLSKFEFLPSHR